MQREVPGFERVVTPEAVLIELDVAGLGSRMIAMLLDTLIQAAFMIGALIVVAGFHLSSSATLVVLVVASFMLLWGYFVVFEGLWHGQTPGKRAQRLRAVRTDGQPMSGMQMFVRNLVRIVDFLPAYYMVGTISIAVTKRSQRLGDLAAGTLVIREKKPVIPVPLASTPPPMIQTNMPRLDVTGMTEAGYQLVRSFLQRRSSLDPAVRADIGMQIAETIVRVVSAPPQMPVESFLEAVAVAYQARFGTGKDTPEDGSPSFP